MHDMNNKNNQVKTILGIAVGILAYFLLKQFLFAPTSFDKQLMQVASELNKTCPIMVDSETQLDNTIALPDNIFQYNNTLINRSAEEIEIEEMEISLHELLVRNIKITLT